MRNTYAWLIQGKIKRVSNSYTNRIDNFYNYNYSYIHSRVRDYMCMCVCDEHYLKEYHSIIILTLEGV